MFARVIPLLRTPPGVEAFDYRIPKGLHISPGSVVRIPFRKRIVLGVVESISSSSEFSKRAADIASVRTDIVFPQPFLDLLSRTAAHTFSSKPAVLKAWLRHIPVKVSEATTAPIKAKRSGAGAEWSNGFGRKLLERAAAIQKKERVLVLTPWKHRALAYAEALQADALTSELSDGAAFRAWHGFLSKKTGVLVATRIGAWLAPLSQTVLIDEPENDDHKSDELAPRYDARKLALWSAKTACVTAYGLTPPLHVDEPAPDIDTELKVVVRHTKGRSDIPFIQADALQLLREHEGSRVIIHGVQGTASKFSCRDCGWTALCESCDFPLSPQKNRATCRRCGRSAEAPLNCAVCGGADLGKALPGIERLEAAAAKHEPELAVDWRSTAPWELESPLPKGCAVLVTDGNLLASAGSEDVRRNERNITAFRRLADAVSHANGTLIIQSSEDQASVWPAWLRSEGVAEWKRRERTERQAFGYPPMRQLVKAIVMGDERAAASWMKTAEARLGSRFKIRGPYEVSYRPKGLKPRFVFHLLPRESMRESELVRTLTPLADSAIIDLDPIAFFR